MPRPLVLLVLLAAAALCAGSLLRRCAAAEPWETQPYAEVPNNSALMRMAPTAPPQRPMATQRPASWPSSTTTPGTAPSGEVYVNEVTTPSQPAVSAAGYSYPTTAYPTAGYPTTGLAAGMSSATALSPAAASPAVGTAWTAPIPGAAAVPVSVAPPDLGLPAGNSLPIRPGDAESHLEAGPGIVAELKLCEEAKPIAVVGGEWILAAEVLGYVNQVLHDHGKELAAFSPRELEEYRKSAIQQVLQAKIEVKLIYLDAKRHLPAENLPKIKDKAAAIFEDKEVPQMMAKAKVGSRQELDAKLQAAGTSLDRQKQQYIEQLLVQQWRFEQIKKDEPLGPAELLAYYDEHHKDYEHLAQARWQQLMVRFSDYPSKQEAWAAIATMGNQVQEGAAFAEVAKARSAGPTAKDGGRRPWTIQGSLVSKVLDEAIFRLPVGQLSQILEDSQGFHIVQVVERKPAGRTPFEEAQVEIAKKIHEQRHQKQMDDYLAKLRKEIPVWTVYDKAEGNPLASNSSTPAPKP